MKHSRKWQVKDSKYFCPKCGGSLLAGKSRQNGEDVCSMWVECAKCGYDPTGGDSYEQVETVWGWEDELAAFALEIWHDKVGAMAQSKDASSSGAIDHANS